MSETNRKAIGAQGEQLVRLYIERLGWQIVATNYRCSRGEVDLIAREKVGDEETLVFVEVKARRGRGHGAASEAVDRRKQQRLTATAAAFLVEQGQSGEEPACRFDVAEVITGPDGLCRIELHRAAFMEG